jgi:hypothetical protein
MVKDKFQPDARARNAAAEIQTLLSAIAIAALGAGLLAVPILQAVGNN